MKILIFGASGSGTTTLAGKLAEKADFVHLDADDYYWEMTEIPFTKKVAPLVRNESLRVDLEKHSRVVVSGSLVSWGEYWHTAFDLVVFIYLDKTIRLERLRKREEKRYGAELRANKVFQENSKAFLEWAAGYDHGEFTGRSLRVHEAWIKNFTCQIVRLDGQDPLEEKLQHLLKLLNR